MNNICFTGHRQINITSELKSRLTKLLESLIANGATDFYAGGAIGWDMLCERTVLTLRDMYPQIKLRLILPCPAEEQVLKWNKTDSEEYKRIMALADTTEICSYHYHESCMRERNKRLIELADCCVCYYDSRRRRSGTGQTVKMAEKKNIRIVNLAI